MLSDPVAEAFGLIHRHPSGENFGSGLGSSQQETKTDGEVCLVSMLGRHACLDDLGSSSAIHHSPSPEF